MSDRLSGKLRGRLTIESAAVMILLLALAVTGALAQSNLRRVGDALGPKVLTLDCTALRHDRVVIAIRTETQKLQVAVWQVDATGVVTRLGAADAGLIYQTNVVALDSRRFVTAVRGEGNALILIAWGVDDAGVVKRLGSVAGGEIGDLALTALGNDRVITAVRTAASNKLKLIAWKVDAAGNIQRLGESTGAAINQVGVCGVDDDLIATAVLAGGKLKVTAWTVSAAGVFSQKGSSETAAQTKFEISPLSYRRVVTAGTAIDKVLKVITWDIAEGGNVTVHSQAAAGKVSQVAVTPLSASRVLTAVRQEDGTLKIINWDAVDQIVRLGDVTAGAVVEVHLAALSNERIVSAVQQGDWMLKVIAWNEYCVPLLHGEWGPKVKLPAIHRQEFAVSQQLLQSSFQRYQLQEQEEKPLLQRLRVPVLRDEKMDKGGTDQSPPYASKFTPGIEGVDAMIAAGHQYLVVSQQGTIGFFDKNGQQLPPKAGESTRLSARDFFITFITATNPDGSPNEQNINRHTGFPPNACKHSTPAEPGKLPCMNQFYDTRVHYDPVSHRFFILSAVRPYDGNAGIGYDNSQDLCTDPLVRRYYAFAISRTEDPRDGFFQYITTETNYSDWPLMTVNDGLLILGHYNHTTTKDGLKPVAYVFPVSALKIGNPHPPSQKIYPTQTSGHNLVPVTHYGATNGWSYFVRPIDTTLEVYALKTPANFTDLIALHKSTVVLDEAPSKLRAGAVYRNGRIHFSCMKKVTDEQSNLVPARFSIRLARVPLVNGPGGVPQASKDPGQGFLFTYFGRSALEDQPGDLVSYELPAMAVTPKGDMAVVYGRYGVTTQKTFYPECRYSVYYNDSRGLLRSRLLQAGECSVLYTPSGSTEKKAGTQSVVLDYCTAVVDPADETVIWMVHEYADAGRQNYKTIVGKLELK